MAESGIFLIQNDGAFVRLKEQAYDSEEVLQRLLAQYPDVLAGGAGSGEPQRWLLVKREIAISDDEAGAARWYLDHLFIDQEGIPTLVEVKRSSDTRIRREVVGQMLDYAANAVMHWTVDRLESEFAATARSAGREPGDVLRELLGDEPDEQFWGRVKTNLQAGRVRLVFVADAIPTELQRVVEFLNEQMDPAEVLAVEVKQFIGQGVTSLVPTVVGRTAEARARKAAPGSGPKWSANTFVARVRERSGELEAGVVERILTWAGERGLRRWWGSGQTEARFYPMADVKGSVQYTFAVCHNRNGFIQFQFPQMLEPFNAGPKRDELLQRVGHAIDQQLDESARFPSVRLTELGDRQRLDKVLGIMDWVLKETADYMNGSAV